MKKIILIIYMLGFSLPCIAGGFNTYKGNTIKNDLGIVKEVRFINGFLRSSLLIVSDKCTFEILGTNGPPVGARVYQVCRSSKNPTLWNVDDLFMPECQFIWNEKFENQTK